MIATVSFDKTTYADLPHKFEAGTPNIAGGIALKTAIDWINQIGLDKIVSYEKELMDYATEELSKIESIQFIGQAQEKAGVISFLVGDIHPYDIGMILDKLGVAVRTGHHCAQPVMDQFLYPRYDKSIFCRLQHYRRCKPISRWCQKSSKNVIIIWQVLKIYKKIS